MAMAQKLKLEMDKARAQKLIFTRWKRRKKMKRFVSMGLAMIATMAILTGAAWALEQEVSGEWRTRAYINQDWDGDDGVEAYDYHTFDTRMRLFYKADVTEGLRFHFALEVGDIIWGQDFDTTGGFYDKADVGTDDISIEVKHMYADFDWGKTNWKLGAQELVIARGFIVYDDFYAANITWNSDAASTNFIYAKLRDGYVGNGYVGAEDVDDGNLEVLGVYPKFTLGNTTVVPGLTWAHSGDFDQTTVADDEHDSFYLSLDLDHTINDTTSVWFTGIYKGGSETSAGVDTDFSSWLLAFGGTTMVKDVEVHGQAFYATGDDDATDDEDNTFSFVNSSGYFGQSYYWAEILGYGWFDYNYVPTGSPADQVGNVWAINLGATITLTERTSLILDVWKAQLAEDNAFGESDLGIEIDARLSTQIIPDYLYLDVIGAYLFAGDAVSADGKNDENPVEAGMYLAIYF